MLSCEWCPSMILEKIKIYSQNIWKNNFLINTILKTHLLFDIIFIQEPSWSVIWTIPSSSGCEGKELVGVPNHLNWTIFSRNYLQADNFSCVISYINICLSYMHFSLWNDILNHKDISCISFFNYSSIYFLINVYSDLSQSALKYLKDTKVNIDNILIMIKDFNIRDSFWNPSYPYHSSYKNTFFWNH